MPRVYPVDRLSFSSVKEYLGNQWRFHRIYVLKQTTFTDSPATLVGKAFHKCLELYYGSDTFRTEKGIEAAKETGLQIIRAAASQVDWGKTGSLEKAEGDALQTIEHYFLEDPQYQTLGVVTPERILSGKLKAFPVTIKAVADLTIEGDETVGLGVIDFKKVSQLLTALDPTPAMYILQAWFNQKAFLAATGKKLDWMIFHEVKTSKNKDGTAQSFQRRVVFNTEEWKKMDKVITKMVKAMLRDISRKNRVWLPNISDQMAGQESWQEFIESSG